MGVKENDILIKADYDLKKFEKYKKLTLKEKIYDKHNIKEYESCPYCGCKHFIKYGKYQDIQRYKCKNEECRKTFSNTTFSVWKYLKYKPEKWIEFIELMCEGMTLESSARILKITTTTAFYWRHKILHAVENYYKPESFRRSVSVMDYYVTKCFKGSRNKHYTYEDKIENRTAKMYGYMPRDVEILISAEDDAIPLINVKDNNETLKDTFKYNVLDNTESGCYVHLEHINKRKIEECTIEHNKNLHKDIKKKYGFKVYINWVGIRHMKDDFKVCKSMKNFIGGLNSWLWKFKGIATKYIGHYYSFYSLINSEENFDYMKIFFDILKNGSYGSYASADEIINIHLENY